MKHPKLKQNVLCQALLYAPFVVFSVGGLALGISLCEVLPTWLFVTILFSGLLLGLAYLIFLRFLFADSSALLFEIRNWYSLRTEYVTGKNGSSRGAVKGTVFRRCRRWGVEVPQPQYPECTLFYRNVRSLGISTAPHPYRVAVFSVMQLDQRRYRRCILTAQQVLRTAPPRILPKSSRPGNNAAVRAVIILADTITPECRALPYQNSDLRICIADCSAGKYYMDSRQEPYSLDSFDRNAESCAVLLLWKLVFGGRPPLKTSPATVPYTLPYSPETSLWSYISDAWKDLRHARENYESSVKSILRNLPENQVCMDDSTIYYKYHTRLYSCNFLPDKRNPKRISCLTPDTESLQYDKKHEKIVRQACSKEEDARLISAVRNWAAMEGYSIEQDDESEV